ncbi:lysine 2,3-aminomutase [Streptomyces sp. ACA25]|uniref:KamA family radical SAM protein n=1 Tax=Streptomyces sp. ACA25 TaxID=3022596 RepID=UPI0023077FD2|nr:lysine 2,3-aminomutase [Streptomyces sp. ACA25]MDB1088076.1 lysine 2,3-aminomutase [Streptomyces sp. ACA25]
MKIYSSERLARLAADRGMPDDYLRDLRVVSSVLPFKVNEYVADELIDWSAAPDDPIFRLTFPHRDMLPPHAYQRMATLLDSGADRKEIKAAAQEIQTSLNPHPGDQLASNVPLVDGRRVEGLQHKYAETMLVFPSQGQTCHSYCGYCFRWAQFVGISELRQAIRGPEAMEKYLAEHPEITDVLFTGGDPMIMKTEVLRRWTDPLLTRERDTVRTLRFGTKALSYWPQRFTSDPDADDLLRLFEEAIAAGKHVAVMAHFSHPNELETDEVRKAVSRIRSTGAVIRTQAPLIAHINDAPGDWSRMWQRQVEMGMSPYYMFMERDTGAQSYFGVPVVRALEIYRAAVRGLSGLGRTARGPVMSAAPGKVHVHGIAEAGGEKAFVLSFLQARDPELVGRPFFAAYDESAEWWDDFKPLPGVGTLGPQ